MALRSDRPTQTEPLSDEALVALVAHGQAEALEQLYARYSRVIYGLALRILRNTDLAEEMVQETFWRVWRRASTFQNHTGQFAPWLFGIARNLCIDELRRRQSRPQRGGTEDEIWLTLPDPQPAVDEQTWETERRRLINQALDELPADQRQVIELAYFGGLSQREIADQLDNPLGTIKTRVRLALQKLRSLLQHQGIGLEDR